MSYHIITEMYIVFMMRSWIVNSIILIADVHTKLSVKLQSLRVYAWRMRRFSMCKLIRKGEIIVIFICYPKCSTCQKAKKWLNEHNVEYVERHIVEENPTYDELKEWYAKSGLPLKRFFNTSGNLYKEMKLKDRLSDMSEDEQLTLLATNGMLVKRPLIVNGDIVLVGFKETEWTEKLM